MARTATARNTAAQAAAVDINAKRAEFAAALVTTNPALVRAAAPLALAYSTPNDMLAALEDADVAKRAALVAAATEEAETAALVAAALAAADAAIDGLADGEYKYQSMRSDFLRVIAEELNSYAQILRIGVNTREPWFALHATKLPEQISARRARVLDTQRAAGHSNPDMSWSRVREYAREDAAKRQWWGLTPSVVAAQAVVAAAAAETKAARAAEKAAAKTPHAKAVSQVKSLAKLAKGENSGLDTPEIRAALTQLCAAFSLDYGTI